MSHEVQLRCLNHMVDTGEYIAPDTYDDLAFGVEWCRQLFLTPYWFDLPDAHRDTVRRYVLDCHALMARLSAAPPSGVSGDAPE